MSYSLGVYRNGIRATRDFISFASFVSFFPQLVAGPIERAKNLLPQFLIKRKFNYDFAISEMQKRVTNIKANTNKELVLKLRFDDEKMLGINKKITNGLVTPPVR